MGCGWRTCVILGLLLFASAMICASSSKDDFGYCKSAVKQWASSSLHLDVMEDKHILKDLLFFLHIPRTGGRTYFYCFLKKLYPSSLECPRSYDKLRFDPSKSDCRLLATHDDYSMMTKLPRDRTSVVTILRDPVDRVFSTYEFSIEVAARFLVHPNLTSVSRMASCLRSKRRGLSTLDIWPWRYLVPWMREDLFGRRDARELRGQSHPKSNDSYDMEEYAMPLREYINDPIALDIVHNGATFQVAGLTNNSQIGEAHEVRHCVTKYQTLGRYVLDVAKKRLDSMLYIGLTEDHRESATVFANEVGAQVISQLLTASSGNSTAATNKADENSSISNSKSDNSHRQTNSSFMSKEVSTTEKVKSEKQNMTVEKLMDSYGTCISGLRKAQAQRRSSSLKRIAPAIFTKEGRLRVPRELLEEIAALNSLDVELYKHAKVIFANHHRIMQQKPVDSVTPERWQIMFENTYSILSWRLLAVTTFLLVFFVFLFIKARRRTSKLKL